MKLHTRILTLLLAGVTAVSLAACTGGGDTEDITTPPPVSPENTPSSILPDDFVVDTTVADLCLATAGIPGDFALFTVNDAPVTTRSYLYWLVSNISYISSYYSPDGDWSDPAGGSSFTDYIKAESLNAAACYALVAAKAQELDCELTQEQIDELEGNLALSSLMLGGEEAFENELRKVCLDYDTLYQINAAPYYFEQLMNGLYSDHPTADEMAAYIEENDILYAKHILLATVDLNTREPLDEDTIAAKKATAERLLAQLQSSTDLAADFDALMNEYSEDPGLASNPDGYIFTANEMVSEFETATRELEFGQISGLVESSTTGYHIILRLDPDTEDNRMQYRADLMSSQLQTWLDEADIVLTDEYEALNPQIFYEKFMAYQEAFSAEAAADPDADPSADPEADPSPSSQGN